MHNLTQGTEKEECPKRKPRRANLNVGIEFFGCLNIALYLSVFMSDGISSVKDLLEIIPIMLLLLIPLAIVWVAGTVCKQMVDEQKDVLSKVYYSVCAFAVNLIVALVISGKLG